MKMKQLGIRIRALREKQGLTQQELADRLQVTRQTVSHYEIGRSQPDLEMLERMVGVLNVDVAVLLGEDSTPVRVTVRAKMEQLRSREGIPWAAIIAYLLIMPVVYILQSAFLWEIGLGYIGREALKLFFWPALLLPVLIGVDYLLERQGRTLRWRLRVVAAALMLLFIFGMAAYQEGVEQTEKEHYDFQTIHGVVVEITEVPQGAWFDPKADYHFAICEKTSTVRDRPPTAEDIFYFTYLQEYYPLYMHFDRFELGDVVTVTTIYPASADTEEKFVFPVTAVKNYGKPDYVPTWLEAWLQEQAQK